MIRKNVLDSRQVLNATCGGEDVVILMGNDPRTTKGQLATPSPSQPSQYRQKSVFLVVAVTG